MRKPLAAILMTSALVGGLLAAGHGEADEIADGEILQSSTHAADDYLTSSNEEETEGHWRGRNVGVAARTQTIATRGLATWYGPGFHGRPMRNGDVFNADDSTTAAANAFPLGTWLRVTNIESGASIDVCNTDTGAFTFPVVVDLSEAAFERLANLDDGVLEVLVQPLRRE